MEEHTLTDAENRPAKPAFAAKMKNPFILAALPGDNSFFKYVGGTLLIIGFYFIGQTPMALAMTVFAKINRVSLEAVAESGALMKLGFDNNLYLFLAIVTFMVGDLGIWITVRFIHRRHFLSLITPFIKVNWKKVFTAFFIYLALTATTEGIGYALNPGNYVFHFNAGNFAILFLITVFLLPFQTSFEELFFRGYLMQGFSFMFRRTWPALLITSGLFALMHSWNPEVEKFGFLTMFPFYFSFGLLLGYITLQDKGLEIALAVHAANNMFGSLFLTFEGSALETDALFLQKDMDPAGMMPYYLASMLLFLFICSFVFGWWKKKTNPKADNFVSP